VKKVYIVTRRHGGVASVNTFASYYEAQRFVKFLLDDKAEGDIIVSVGERAKELSCG
jgi:hypothetical protein